MKLRGKDSTPATASKTINPKSEHKLGREKEQMMPSTSKSCKLAVTAVASSSSVYSTRRSSTASAEFSPDSPSFGRVAKSNARLLNGLISSGKGVGGSYLDTGVALPELKIYELADKCPTINKLLKAANAGGSSEDASKLNITLEQLSTIQVEVEELCVQNVDYQRTIHGEITYLTTGEYPTEDLRSRPMPNYVTLTPEQFKRLTDRAKHAESTANTSLADLGLLSSPEDDETPHILDVPQRFWTWAREYLRHISADTVEEFQDKLLSRFSEELIIGKYCQEDTKFDQMQQISPDTKNSSPTKSATAVTKAGHGPLKRKFSIEEDSSPSSTAGDNFEHSQKSGKTPTKQAKITNTQKLVITNKISPVNSSKLNKKWAKYPPLEPARASVASTNLLLNQNVSKITETKSLANGRLSNGTSSSGKAKVMAKSSFTKQNKTSVNISPIRLHRRSSKTPMSPNLSKNEGRLRSPSGKFVSNKIVDTPKLRGVNAFLCEEEEEQSSDEEDGEEMDEDEEMTDGMDKKPNGDDEEMIEQKPGTSGTSCITPIVQDEVTAELAKKQAQLRELYTRTRPSIERIYARLLKEYAVYEAFHQIDDADHKLFEIGSKFERLYTFNREQKLETKAAVEQHQQIYAKFHPNAEIVKEEEGNSSKAKPMKTGK